MEQLMRILGEGFKIWFRFMSLLVLSFLLVPFILMAGIKIEFYSALRSDDIETAKKLLIDDEWDKSKFDYAKARIDLLIAAGKESEALLGISRARREFKAEEKLFSALIEWGVRLGVSLESYYRDAFNLIVGENDLESNQALIESLSFLYPVLGVDGQNVSNRLYQFDGGIPHILIEKEYIDQKQGYLINSFKAFTIAEKTMVKEWQSKGIFKIKSLNVNIIIEEAGLDPRRFVVKMEHAYTNFDVIPLEVVFSEGYMISRVGNKSYKTSLRDVTQQTWCFPGFVIYFFSEDIETENKAHFVVHALDKDLNTRIYVPFTITLSSEDNDN